jgi:hypothetical protein
MLLAPDDPDDKRNLVVRTLLTGDNAVRAGAVTKVLSPGPNLTVARPWLGVLPVAPAPDGVPINVARLDGEAWDGIRVAVSDIPRPIELFGGQDDPALMEPAIGAGEAGAA